MNRIHLNGVTKEYSSVLAVDDVHFSFQAGSITALLGPNGAGKSSLIRMLAGFTRPDRGHVEVHWNGDMLDHLPASAYAYLPEDRGLYDERTLQQNLTYVGRLRHIRPELLRHQIDKWLDVFSLTDRRHALLSTLSKGNQQKAQVISTLLGEPDLLILDEPFSGLDPINQEKLLQVLQGYREAGKGVLLSAHQMALVERITDDVLMLNHGRVLAKGSLKDVRQQLNEHQQCTVFFQNPVSAEAVAALASVAEVQGIDHQHNRLEVQWNPEAPLQPLLDELKALGPIQSIHQAQTSLHDLYLKAVHPAATTREATQ